MADPSFDKLRKSYFDKQLQRTLIVLNRIIARDPLGTGRVIPNASDIPVHDGRHLDATVVFLDICKFSQRPAWTIREQELLLRIISLFFSEMIRIIEDHGGVVEKNTGDGLMAYFVSTPHSNVTPQQVAVAAALTMFYAATNLINPILKHSGVEPIDFRICMDHGPVTIANVGVSRGFKGIVAIGTTANIACKMLSWATPNSILLGTMALDGLPIDWKSSFTQFKTSETGWVYREGETPYSFWEYTGRWTKPLP